MNKSFFIIAIFLTLPLWVDAATINKAPNNLGLVGYWPFEEGVGSTTLDRSGYRNNATSTTGASWTNGKIGKGFNLNDTTGYLAVADAPSLNPTTAITMSMWAKSDAVATGQALSKYDSVSANVSYEIQFWNDGKIYANFKLTGGFISTLSCSYVANTWYHVTAVFDSTTDTARLYLNGTQCNSVSTSGTIMSSATSLYIGSSGGNSPFGGLIDQVRIYNRALTATEVRSLYNSGGAKVQAPSKSGLVAHFPLDEGAGTAPRDISGVGNTASFSNSPTWTAGKIAKALSFDGTGTDDYVTIANSSSLQEVQEDNYTLSAWFYLDSIPPGTGSDNNAGYGIVMKAGFHEGLWFFYDGTFRMSHWLTGNVSAEVGSALSYSAGRWYHAAGVVDKTNGTTKIYVNGQLASTTPWTAGTAAREYGTNPWYIGIANPGASTFRWAADGQVDDVRIYNRALSAAEIAGLAQTRVMNASSASLQGAGLASGLVGHWTFDGKDTVSTIADVSGQANHGYFIGAATSSAKTIGKLGQALLFDGASTHVSISNNSSLNFGSNNFTISCWAKVDPAISNYGRCVDKDYTDGYALMVDPGGEWVFEVNGNSSRVASPSTYKDNKWHHVVGVRTGNTTGSLYIDGVLVSSGNVQGGTMTDSSSLGIGGGYSWLFKGVIDDVRVYNRALSASEVTQLYNLGR